MRSLATTAVLLLVLTALAPSASGYDIVSGHPRLFLRAAEVPTLRAKCTGPLSSDYQTMKSWCDSKMGMSLPFGSQDFYEHHLAAYSFVWLMSSDTTYASRAKQIAQYVVDHNLEDSLPATEGLSHFLDWCYDYLSPTERTFFGGALADGAQWNLAQVNWTGTTNYHEKLSQLEGVVYPGIVLYGEGIDDATARLCCDTFHEHVFEDPYVVCCYDELASDGSWFEGGYNYYRIYHRGREAAEAWATATTGAADNIWQVCGNFQNLGRYYLYEFGARSGYSFTGSKQGDTHTHTASHTYGRPSLYNAARRLSDGRAQWLANEMQDQGLGSPNDWNLWRIIVWKDTSLGEIHPSGVYGEESSAFFEGMGTVYFRSGWDISSGSSDVYAVFRCERFPALHSHAHQNHFMIARGGDLLAIDSGAYDYASSSHNQNYFCRTIAHNTITVYDPGETTFEGRSNDGGQKPKYLDWEPLSHCGDVSLPHADRGRIVAYEESPTLTYAKGDATAAYASSKLTNFTRELVWLKPDTFVVLDRITATSSSFKKTWLLHSLNEPSISGDTVTIQEGGSKLFVKSVLPSPRAITKVGGPGREFEVNGVNYPPSGSPPDDAGSWRIEVSPTANANEHVFLHVLYVTDAGASSMPNVSFIDAGDMIGAEIGEHVVLFSATGAVVDDVSYEYGGP